MFYVVSARNLTNSNWKVNGAKEKLQTLWQEIRQASCFFCFSTALNGGIDTASSKNRLLGLFEFIPLDKVKYNVVTELSL